MAESQDENRLKERRQMTGTRYLIVVRQSSKSTQQSLVTGRLVAPGGVRRMQQCGVQTTETGGYA